MGWATLWAPLSQAHLVTLPASINCINKMAGKLPLYNSLTNSGAKLTIAGYSLQLFISLQNWQKNKQPLFLKA
jgi:hypothetical protein